MIAVGPSGASENKPFDRLAELALDLMGADIAIVSLDMSSFWPDRGAITSAAFRDDGDDMVAAVRSEVRALAHASHAAERGFELYVEIPLRSEQEQRLGKLVVLGREARDVGDREIRLLKKLGHVVVDVIESRVSIDGGSARHVTPAT